MVHKMEIEEFISSVESLRNDLFRQAKHYLGNADDAEDAVQETLMKMWIARNRIVDTSKIKNMASVVCHNVSLNMLRKTNHSVPVENAISIVMYGDPHVQLEENEIKYKLKQSVRKLSDKQRILLRMRNVDNMSYSDIAKIVGSTESSVRGMICKARKELLKQMRG